MSIVTRTFKRIPLSLVRYAISGGSAFLVEYILFYGLFSGLHWQLYVANTLSFCTGLVVSFMLNRKWTFKSQSFRLKKHAQFAIYSSLAAANLFLGNVIIGLLQHAGLDPRIGKVAVMILIVCWNFTLFKLVIFKSDKAGTDGHE